MKIEISKIIIGNRHRKDMGDLKALADSIKEIGLLQAIGVKSDYTLVWGERRLKACQSLGWTEIEAVIDPTLDDYAKAAQAENDENRCRKEFTLGEAVSIAEHIRGVVAAAAKERIREGGEKGRNERYGLASAETAEARNPAYTRPSNETRAKVAAIVGMSHDTLTRATEVVKKGTPELIEAMDKREIPVATAARLATLPHERQREVIAEGRDAMLEESRKMRVKSEPAKPVEKKEKAVKTKDKRPGLVKAFSELKRFSKRPEYEISVLVLRDLVADLERELGDLIY